MPAPARSPLRRAVCVALVLSQLTACTTWRPVPRTLDPQLGPAHIDHARVWLRDGSRLPLRDVTLGTDSVIGYGEDAHERHAHPVAAVASVDRLQVSAGRTAVVVGTSVVAVAALVGAALGAEMGSFMGSVFSK